jgi:predicted amidohydrolase
VGGLKVAAVSWAVRPILREQDFFDHLESVVYKAATDLVVLPELVVLELLSLYPDASGASVPRILESYADRYEAELNRLSRETGALIVGGSHIKDNKNVSSVGEEEVHKMILTQWESTEWGLDPGSTWGPCRSNPSIGVTVCYDSEFPSSGRMLAEAGVLVHCIPAYTETQRGFQRVRWCAQARATENQVYVIHASLVGSLGREPVPSTFGSSAILTPSIEPFPVSAILDETALGEEGVATAELNFDVLLQARGEGDVRNWNDRNAYSWEFREP